MRERPAVNQRHEQLYRLIDRVRETDAQLIEEIKRMDLPNPNRSGLLREMPIANFTMFENARERYQMAVKGYNRAYRRHTQDRCCVVE